MRRRLALLAPLLLLASCGGGAKPADEIAFTANDDGYGEIWVMRRDGSDRRRLTAAAPPKSDAAAHPPEKGAKPMKMNEPMAGEMKKDSMTKGDVKKAAEKKDRDMKEMMEKEEKAMKK